MISTERYVQLLQRGWTRGTIGFVALLLGILGGCLYSPFNNTLIVSVEPTPESESGVAHAVYERYFAPDPVQLIVVTSSKSGAALVNLSATLEINTSQPLQRWVSFNSSTALTAQAAARSHEVKKIVAAQLDLTCRCACNSRVIYTSLFT